MAFGVQQFAGDNKRRKILRWLNILPGEVGRTLVMFLFYVMTSIGVLWFEASSNGLFLEYFGSASLPLIYIASTVISITLGVGYTALQSIISLRWVIVLIALLMAAPLPLLLQGLEVQSTYMFLGMTAAKTCVFMMSLWLQAIYVLNDLNASIASNQLFNIREIKRTYPLISSGVLVADVLSGFALPLVLNNLPEQTGLSIVILASFAMMVGGALLLFYVGRTYGRYFPSGRRRSDTKKDATVKRMRGELKRYRWYLFIFFILAEATFLLVDFQFKTQLETSSFALFSGQPAGVNQGKTIAAFIGVFQGVLGFFELAMQWGAASRLIEWIGIFRTAAILPMLVLVFGGISIITPLVPDSGIAMIQQVIPKIEGMAQIQFVTIILFKFLYELVHFTLLASIGPVLFQPIPDSVRSEIQSSVRGTAEPIATGLIGLSLFAAIYYKIDGRLGENWILALSVVMLFMAAVWLVANYLVRRDYVQLLVLGSGRMDIRSSEIALKEFQRSAIETLSQRRSESDQRACIELLSQIDPKTVGDVLTPMLTKFTPALQHKALEIMLVAPDPKHLVKVAQLLSFSRDPDVTAASLRYVTQASQSEPDIEGLKRYLPENIPAVVRGTAASLLLECGSTTDKALATKTLRLMLTHGSETERSMGCKAMSYLKYLQALQLYIPNLVKDSSLQVRRAILNVIAATHQEKMYPYLVNALQDSQTRGAAQTALIYLGDEAVPLLCGVIDDFNQADAVRQTAWTTLSQIGTITTLDVMVQRLNTQWGEDRRNILRAIVKVDREEGIEMALSRLGREGIEGLINQEIRIMGQACAALLDLITGKIPYETAEMLRRALVSVQTDSSERLFLLMQFLYEPRTIQAAAFSLQSGSSDAMAQGLELLDTQLDIPYKRALLNLLDRNPELEREQKRCYEELVDARKKGAVDRGRRVYAELDRLAKQHQADLEKQLESLNGIMSYDPLTPSDRLSYLLDLRHFMSDWVVAACFHLAREGKWDISRGAVTSSLRATKGFVREAALLYLKQLHELRRINDEDFWRIIPRFSQDRDPLVRQQVSQWMASQNKNRKGMIPFPEPDGDDIPTAVFNFLPQG
jgi:HEAT repeat protein/ATP/ADP translocase